MLEECTENTHRDAGDPVLLSHHLQSTCTTILHIIVPLVLQPIMEHR